MLDPNRQYSERELIELAVTLAEKSVSENDGRSHPLVGAVISRDGHVLQTGFRNEKPNLHAEEAALEKLTTAQAVGTTVYTTLEPTVRGKMACTQRLITKGVSRVVIGMLDPNQRTRRVSTSSQRSYETPHIWPRHCCLFEMRLCRLNNNIWQTH
jgi:pyrimidine deaminase RibD-like protein